MLIISSSSRYLKCIFTYFHIIGIIKHYIRRAGEMEWKP